MTRHKGPKKTSMAFCILTYVVDEPGQWLPSQVASDMGKAGSQQYAVRILRDLGMLEPPAEGDGGLVPTPRGIAHAMDLVFGAPRQTLARPPRVSEPIERWEATP